MITVVGDVILDRYCVGRVSGVNPEGDGVAFDVESEIDRLGGAAGVANILSGFGSQVTLGGVIGDDWSGGALESALEDAGIANKLCVSSRPTAWRLRTVVGGRMMSDRIDRQDRRPIDSECSSRLGEIPIGDVLVFSDHDGGVFSEQLWLRLASRSACPVLVSPKRNWGKFWGASVIVANKSEAAKECQSITTSKTISDFASTKLLSKWLSDHYEQNIVVTDGCQGMWCSVPRRKPQFIPAEMVLVRDQLGAGDTVLASLAFALANDINLIDGCRIASVLAGEQVGRMGVARIRWPGINLRRAAVDAR